MTKLTAQQQRELLALQATVLRLRVQAEHLRHQQQQLKQQDDEAYVHQTLNILATLPSQRTFRQWLTLPLNMPQRIGVGVVWWLWQRWRAKNQ